MKLNIFKKFIFAGLPICAILCVSNLSAMKRSATWAMPQYSENNNTGIDDIFALEPGDQIYNDDTPLISGIPSTPNNLSTITATTSSAGNNLTDDSFFVADGEQGFISEINPMPLPSPLFSPTYAPIENMPTDQSLQATPITDFFTELSEAQMGQMTTDFSQQTTTTNNNSTSSSTTDSVQVDPEAELQTKTPLKALLNKQHKLAQADIKENRYSDAIQKLLDIIKKIKTRTKELTHCERGVLRKNTYYVLGSIFEKTSQTEEVCSISNKDISQKLKEGKKYIKDRNLLLAQNIFLSILKITHSKKYSSARTSALCSLGRITEILSEQGTIPQQPVQKSKAHSSLYLELNKQHEHAQADIKKESYSAAIQKLLDIIKKIKKNKQLTYEESNLLRMKTYSALGRILEFEHRAEEVYSISENDITQKFNEGKEAIDKKNYIQAQNIFLSILRITHKKRYCNERRYAIYYLGKITRILSNSSTTNNNNNSTSTLTTNNNLTFSQTTTLNSTITTNPTNTTATSVAQPVAGQATSSSTVHTPKEFAYCPDQDFD